MKTYSTLSEAWVLELAHTRAFGEEFAPRGQATIETRWSQFAIDRPLTFPVRAEGREFRNVIGILEALSLVGQFSVPELFTDRVRKFLDFEDAGVFHGSYGARIAGRLGDLVDLLKRDPDSRQAVLTIFDSRSDLGAAKRDIPCTIAIHFLVRDGELEMRVTMRSNDLWLGTPYDLLQFAVLQASVAQALGLVPGKYVHAAGSLHLYERDFGPASKIGEPLNYAEFPFPLWSPDMTDIGMISQRARDLAFNRVHPDTAFEHWVHELVWPEGTWFPGMSPA